MLASLFQPIQSDFPHLTRSNLQYQPMRAISSFALAIRASSVRLQYFGMTIKASIGKLSYDSSIVEDLPNMGIELIMPDTSALHDYKIFNADNKDPFDNILIATALSEKCVFITSDPKILSVTVSGLNLIDATV